MNNDLDDMVRHGNDARHLVEKMRPIFDEVRESLKRRRLNCVTHNEPGLSQDIIRVEQLLEGLERSINRRIQDGEAATIQIEDIDRKMKPRKFSRY